jgi:hypothetical protein
VVASEEVDNAMLDLLSDLSEVHHVAGAGRALAVGEEERRREGERGRT